MGGGTDVDRPKLSVVIPTYNRGSLLIDCLEALSRQTCHPSDYEVLVVDDGSTEHLPDEVYDPKYWAPVAVRCVRQEKNGGPAGARNLGILKAQGEIVLFTGDDIQPHPDLINQHLTMHQENPDPAVAVLGQVKWSEHLKLTSVMRSLERGLQFGYPYIADPLNAGFRFFYTSNLSLRRDFLLAYGLFDDTFPYASWEDIELGYRLEERGLRIHYNPDAVAYHNHPTILESFCVRQYRSGQMALLFGLKHPECVSWLDIPTALAFSRAIRESHLEKIKGFLKAEGVDEEIHETGVIQGEGGDLFRIREEMLEDFLAQLFRLYYLKGIVDGYFLRAYYETLPLRVHKQRVPPSLSHLGWWTLSRKYRALTVYIHRARSKKGYPLLLFSKTHLYFWKLLERFFRGREERRKRKASKLANHEFKPDLSPVDLACLKEVRRAIFFHLAGPEVLEEIRRLLEQQCPDMEGVFLARRKRGENASGSGKGRPSVIYFEGLLDLFVDVIRLLCRKGRPDLVGIFYGARRAPQNTDFLSQALILFLRPNFFLRQSLKGVALFRVEGLSRLICPFLKNLLTLAMAIALSVATAVLTFIVVLVADLLRVLSRSEREAKLRD